MKSQSFTIPNLSDKRWPAFGLLLTFVIMGCTVLGFSRSPMQMACIVLLGCALDVALQYLIKKQWIFPLSAAISCLSLALLVNFSLDYHYLWIPVFLTITSKYVFTFKGKHFFNPSLFGIVASLLLFRQTITIAPAYQWYGMPHFTWMMAAFIISGALLLFVFRINRQWLVLSFLFFYSIQLALRAWVLRFVLPVETLFVGSITSPSFYLFTFYMITDPATSPKSKWDQILQGFLIATVDLLYHLKLSYYTFFFAGMTVASARFVFAHIKSYIKQPSAYFVLAGKRFALILIFAIPLSLAFTSKQPIVKNPGFSLRAISAEQSGLGWEKSNILQQTDPRVAHVAKWLLSVGDAVAIADVNNDGQQDIFLTNTLKTPTWQAKLFINNGNFHFQKINIPDLDRYLGKPAEYGLPGSAFFFDFDNDGDEDLFVGFGFGHCHLFENRLIQGDSLAFREVKVPFLMQENSVCLAANAFDFNNDGHLDLLVANAASPYLTDYPKPKALNIFKLPEPEYIGDRRMLHFMHESWHNANNGGENFLLLNTDSGFVPINNKKNHFSETRWSLATGTADLNSDGYTDLYIANDFGRDDCYRNIHGQDWQRQQGTFYGDLGLDTYKGMNVSIGDLDGNGMEDIYISNVHHELQAEGSLLWMNFTKSGATAFDLKESAAAYNLLNKDRFGWGAAIVDINLDGWPDVIQVNGMVDDSWDKIYPHRMDYWYYQEKVARSSPEIHSYADRWADMRGMSIYENEQDCIFLNQEGQTFIDVAAQVGFNHLANTRGVAAVDFDNDGDYDLLVTDQFGAPKLYENIVQGQYWVGINVQGNGSTCSTDAVGTRVEMSYTQKGKTKKQVREVRLMSGFSAQSSSQIIFGFGNIPIDNIKLTVKWQNGGEEIIPLPVVKKYYNIKQKRSAPLINVLVKK